MLASGLENFAIQLECQICFEDFDNWEKKPIVLDCGHTICQNCLKSIVLSSRRCPFDKRLFTKSNIDLFPINWSYMDIIQNYKKFNRPLREYSNYREFSISEGVYKGQVEDRTGRVRHGYGQMEYIDGSSYLGNWDKDRRSGTGRFCHPDKREYEGEWLDDMPHGNGKYIFNSGEIMSYEGSWRRGKFFGYGKIIYSNKSELETFFVDGISCSDIIKIKTYDNRLIMGQVEYNKACQKIYEIGKDGSVFLGTFESPNSMDFVRSLYMLNIKKNGHGIMYFINGDKYTGSFKDDQMNGKGTLIFSNGGTYEGEFLCNKKHGSGIMTFSNGDIYDGSWHQDVRQGEGSLTKTTGEIYKGNWLKDMKNGLGKLMLNNGYSYDGSWVNDKKEGKGVETFPNHESYYGDFKNNLKDGKGLFVFKNGDTYKGEWLNDKMHGLGQLVTSDGHEINAKWSNGLIVKESGKDKNCIIF